MSIRLLVVLLFLPLTLLAQLPHSFSYQGFLADQDGKPLEGAHQLTFAIYDAAVDGQALWTDSLSVDVNAGLFAVQLGRAERPISADLFDGARFLGVAINGGAEMSPRQFLTSVPTAIKAQDANTVNGKTAAELDQSAHVSNFANPHHVTAAQSGAVSVEQLVTAIEALQPYRFVGISSSTRRGDVGYGGMNEACHADFGEKSRICSVEEFTASPIGKFSESAEPYAWINIRNAGGRGDLRYAVAAPDYRTSGREILCQNWTPPAQSRGGAVIDGRGSVIQGSCNNSHFVTCCSPRGAAGAPVSIEQ